MKKITKYDRWGKKGQDAKTKDLQRDMWRPLEKKKHKQKTKVRTHS